MTWVLNTVGVLKVRQTSDNNISKMAQDKWFLQIGIRILCLSNKRGTPLFEWQYTSSYSQEPLVTASGYHWPLRVILS